MKLKLFFLSLVIVFASSCNKNSTFNISGKIENAAGKTLSINEITSKSVNFLDSVKIDKNGEFKFSYLSSEPIFLLIKLSSTNFIRLVADSIEDIKITADGGNLSKTYQVSGSRNSELVRELNLKLMNTISKVDSLSIIHNDTKDSPNIEAIEIQLNKSYNEIIQNHRKFILDFIAKNPDSPASILALYQQINKSVILSPENDFKYYKKVSDALNKKYPNSKHANSLKLSVNEMQKALESERFNKINIEVGSIAPDISLPTPEGNELSLSSFKGKIVLLDFWASWCRPCRMENPNLVENYKKYHSKGLEILQVSLDKTKDDWVKAIKSDNLTWNHISDLQFWQSAAANTYNVQSIPASFLIDKDGKIIAKDLRGDDLGEKLEEIFGK